MRNTASFGEWGPGRTNIEVAVDLDGVAIDDFAVEAFCNMKGEAALAGAGRTNDGDEGQSSSRCSSNKRSGMCFNRRYTLMMTEAVTWPPLSNGERGSGPLGSRGRRNRMIAYARAALVVVGLGIFGVTPLFCQQGVAAGAISAGKPDKKADAYYTFAMAHLYGELASAYGNRGEYVNKAIDFYKEAMKLDPDSSYIGEELAELYVQTQQLERATTQANELIKANPNNAGPHKILARIYARQIGDPDQGKVDQAMLKSATAEYVKIVELDPKDVESLSMLARLYRISHDDAGAEKVYRQLQVADPNGDDALTGLAAVYADRGDMASAIDMLKQAADRNPDPRTITSLAELYEQNKDYNNAADTWLKALPLTNDNAQVRRHLAASLLAANRPDEALKFLRELSQEDPKNVELQLQLVELLERSGDFVGAHAALSKAQAVGNTPQIRMAEAVLLEAEGNAPKAITVLEGLMAETKKSQYNDAERGLRIQIVELMARMLRGANRIPEAVTTFRMISELNPPAAPRVEVEIIETLMGARDFKGARAAADAALRKFPDERLIRLEHASVLANTGQFDAAITELKAMPGAAKDRDTQMQIAQIQDKGKRFADEAKTLDLAESLSNSAPEKEAIEFMRGAMFERQKNFDAAEQSFRKVLTIDPTNAGAMNYLGYMLADRGVKLDEAHKLISRALEIDPGNGAYLDSLGWALYRLNRLDEAAAELNKALAKIGKDPTVHDHLAEVYAKQGKMKEAIQQWEASITEMKASSAAELDPDELAKITKKLDAAKQKSAGKK